MGLPPIGTLWIGSELGPVEQLCLASMVANGHEVTLYAYGPVLRVPEGVRLADAASVLPPDRVFRHHRVGSPAVFADIFRIEMILRTGRVWLDTDILLLAPFAFEDPVVLDGERDREGRLLANNCVMKVPQDSDLLRALVAYVREPGRILPLLPRSKAARLLLRRLARGAWPLDRFPWGAFGFTIITHELKARGLMGHVVADGRSLPGKLALFEPHRFGPEVVEQAMFAHFTSSKFARNRIDFDRPEDGSVYRLAVERFGPGTPYFRSGRPGRAG
jgi:hypothetical protein